GVRFDLPRLAGQLRQDHPDAPQEELGRLLAAPVGLPGAFSYKQIQLLLGNPMRRLPTVTRQNIARFVVGLHARNRGLDPAGLAVLLQQRVRQVLNQNPLPSDRDRPAPLLSPRTIRRLLVEGRWLLRMQAWQALSIGS